MARQLKRLDSNNTITAIRKDDKLFTSAKKINDVFKKFYEDLYTSTCSASDEDLNSFFQKVELPQLFPEEKDSLDAPITEAEVRTAIKGMKTVNSPGIDGFPVEYYKRHVDVLCPFLTEVFQQAFQYGTLPESLNKAIISLIPKKDKDTTDPANYRPISLINVDCKILSKTLALRKKFLKLFTEIK